MLDLKLICPQCGRVHDLGEAQGVIHQRLPRWGDTFICPDCGAPASFNAKLQLVALSEAAEKSLSPITRAVIDKLRARKQ